MFLRLYRMGVLLVIIILVHQQARWLDAQRGSSISLRQARKFFPAAQRLQLGDAERGLYFATNARGDTIGCLLTTSPQTDNIIGYSGPTDLLIALDFPWLSNSTWRLNLWSSERMENSSCSKARPGRIEMHWPAWDQPRSIRETATPT